MTHGEWAFNMRRVDYLAVGDKVLGPDFEVVYEADPKDFEPIDGGLSIANTLAALEAAGVAKALNAGGARAERVRRRLKA